MKMSADATTAVVLEAQAIESQKAFSLNLSFSSFQCRYSKQDACACISFRLLRSF